MNNDNHSRVAGATVTWGVILLVIAGLAFAIAMFDISTITPAVIGWSVVGLGGLLVVAALVGVVARVSAGSTTEAGATTKASSTGNSPE